ncbi:MULTISPECIES: gamma-glutamyltransferase family protein [Paraburkholderia]|uniref:gamma-glutamyltransferase family protein n=1 Tax=Paraburkholderia TaxID=1822464 RepID=UPI001FEB3012|nr:gamma-glutamyltransferase [Paraburkholderia podalyriae]
MPSEFLNPSRGTRGMAVAPHALAAQSALAILRDGGNAVEAMIAAAATIAVVYPHMNSIGGDGFWLISRPGAEPVGIEACGVAALAATIDEYRSRGLSAIPVRGPLAANTVAGTVSGWQRAHRWSAETLGGRLPVKRLLEDAIHYAKQGVPVTRSQSQCVESRLSELRPIVGFNETFLHGGRAPATGERFVAPRLAATFEQLADAGFDDFYRGDLARSIASDLQSAGSLLSLADLERHEARLRTPLALKHSLGTIYNMPPPTQGLVSLLILGILDRVLTKDMDPLGSEFVHACVEATKLGFAVRDAEITDPDHMRVDPRELLQPAGLDAMAAQVSLTQAAPWGAGRGPGDTVWLGVTDSDGVAVSFNWRPARGIAASARGQLGAGVLHRDHARHRHRTAGHCRAQADAPPLSRRAAGRLTPPAVCRNAHRTVVEEQTCQFSLRYAISVNRFRTSSVRSTSSAV